MRIEDKLGFLDEVEPNQLMDEGLYLVVVDDNYQLVVVDYAPVGGTTLDLRESTLEGAGSILFSYSERGWRRLIRNTIWEEVGDTYIYRVAF